MEEKVRIIIAEDHAIFRRGLNALLAGEPSLHVVGEATDGREALELAQKLQPDILLLDLLMPKVSGLDVLQALTDGRSAVRTIVLSGAVEENDIGRVFELGARALVLKESAFAVLIKCIQAVMTGQYWLGRKISRKPEPGKKNRKGLSTKNYHRDYGLTQREIEIIQAVASGFPNRDIAARLAISEHTVKHHITSIFDKVGVHNRLELTLFAYYHDLAGN